ncbi:MAG: hypothetical protein AAB869_00130 [Patescibacteria group bacterium]
MIMIVGWHARLLFRVVAILCLFRYVAVKHWLLAPYYRGLAVQARYLYRTSELFKLRWQALGYEYAMESFEGETGLYFFDKTRKEHWRIRLHIFVDATCGRKPRPYYLGEERRM